MQLTDHFSLEEFTFSATAVRLGIDNTAPPEAVERLKRLAQMLEAVRAQLENKSLRISSGYRNAELNAVVSGAMTEASLRKVMETTAISEVRVICELRLREKKVSKSDSGHMRGDCADFTCSAFGSPLLIVRKLERADIRYDQLIEEGAWVHIASADNPRGDVLNAKFKDGRATYSKGSGG